MYLFRYCNVFVPVKVLCLQPLVTQQGKVAEGGVMRGQRATIHRASITAHSGVLLERGTLTGSLLITNSKALQYTKSQCAYMPSVCYNARCCVWYHLSEMNWS